MKKGIYLILCVFFIGLNNASSQDINQYDSQGQRHGIWKKKFEGTDQLRYEGQFNHGEEVGLFKFYKLIKKRSVLTATKQYNDNDNIAEVKFYSSRGKVISEGKMIAKFFIGKWVYYHNNSDKIMTIEHYDDDGNLKGERLVYYENGRVAERANYYRGKLEGESFWYSEKSGKVVKAFIYKDDMLHGVAKYYNDYGELIAEGRYHNDKKTGIWRYYKNGNVIDKKDFTVYSKNPKKQKKSN